MTNKLTINEKQHKNLKHFIKTAADMLIYNKTGLSSYIKYIRKSFKLGNYDIEFDIIKEATRISSKGSIYKKTNNKVNNKVAEYNKGRGILTDAKVPGSHIRKIDR